MNELEKLTLFLKINIHVKETLAKAAPNVEDEYTDYSKIKYIDKLKSYTEILKDDFLIMYNLYPLISKDYILNFFEKLNEKIVNFSFQNSVQEFFINNYSDISKTLIDTVNSNCVAYYVDSDITTILKECKTINELLHIYHSILTNTEYLYESLPPTAQKEPQIKLSGMDTPLARLIYDNIPPNLKAGFSFILSVSNNQVLMMLRDLGHATTLEITKDEQNEVYVIYFIPKICN